MDFDSFYHESHMITFAILVEINGFINAVMEKYFKLNVKKKIDYYLKIALFGQNFDLSAQ